MCFCYSSRRWKKNQENDSRDHYGCHPHHRLGHGGSTDAPARSLRGRTSQQSTMPWCCPGGPGGWGAQTSSQRGSFWNLELQRHLPGGTVGLLWPHHPLLPLISPFWNEKVCPGPAPPVLWEHISVWFHRFTVEKNLPQDESYLESHPYLIWMRFRASDFRVGSTMS